MQEMISKDVKKSTRNNELSVKKRNGQTEIFEAEKINKVLIWATSGISGVSASDVAMNSHLQFYPGIKTSEIHKVLIQSAVDLISDKNPNYLDLSNLLKIRKIESNVHYIGEDNKDKTLGAKKHWMGFKNPTKKFIKYKMTWLPKSISIYYDNILVRKIEDENILKQLNATTLNVVINNHVTSKADSTYNWQNFQSLAQESDFTIKQFTYTKL